MKEKSIVKMEGIMTQEEFSEECHAFFTASEELGDSWVLVKKDESEYLVYTHKANINDRLLQFEYHVAYSVSYQVPVLYFKITREDGSILNVEEAWDIFRKSPSNESEHSLDMLKILTQMEHPQLFVPFFALHPCRTAELLASSVNSRNRILTFISSMGPFVHLTLHPHYGRLFS